MTVATLGLALSPKIIKVAAMQNATTYKTVQTFQWIRNLSIQRAIQMDLHQPVAHRKNEYVCLTPIVHLCLLYFSRHLLGQLHRQAVMCLVVRLMSPMTLIPQVAHYSVIGSRKCLRIRERGTTVDLKS
jgi:hypothetical protein